MNDETRRGKIAEAVECAEAILKGTRPVPKDFGTLKDCMKWLKADLKFGLGRKLLRLCRGHYSPKQNVWVVQQLALCTYKDEDQLPDTRFTEALALLDGVGLRNPARVDPRQVPPETLPETLALGGAVYKRIWEQSGQLENLHESLALYRGAWDLSPDIDAGYGGVNGAFVLDILAARLRAIARRSGTGEELARDRAREAQALRADVAKHLEAKLKAEPGLAGQDWFAVTLAEAYFGLGRYPEARTWLETAGRLERSEWEQQTTFKQLVSIARHQDIKPPEGDDPATWHEAWQTLQAILGEHTGPALSCYRGKVGLALSGGGFRASLFHIGVLARLAEMDILRSVEVLSTVSGGSIVGAHYYLEVRHLLQTKPDREIRREDYIDIVRRLQKDFLDAVQENLRTRALTNLFLNILMVLGRYSRSHRMGELYERFIYSKVKDGHWSALPRRMRDLLIRPAKGRQDADGKPVLDGDFNPKFHNWRRRARVPVLLLNATALNSGHSWHFTAKWMGEPPGLVGGDVDVNARHRRLWYSQAPTEDLQDYPLGYAVASSACVPGLFEPLTLKGLYPGRVVRLVDGGVHDNQGVEGLLNEGCTRVLCSDASGQMEDQPKPSDSTIGVPLRSNSILMDRVRESEYQDLSGRVANGALEGLFFIHLKKGLPTKPVDWVNCDDPTEPERNPRSATPYGVDKELQAQLAAIRTDLDSFTEVEAYALMLSGYLMTEHEFRELDRQHALEGGSGHWGDYAVHAPREAWPFLELEQIAGKTADDSDLRRKDLGTQIATGASLFFKIWTLSPQLKTAVTVLGAAGLLALGWYLSREWSSPLWQASFTVGGVAILVVLTLGGILFPLLKWLNPQRAMQGYAWKTLVAVAGWLFTNLHLYVFDPLFLRRGKLKRLLGLPGD